jgi:hypothetical protein
LTNNKTNNGIIRASSGIELEIDGIVVTQSATGRIIGDESNVEIRGGAHIVGGRLETVGAGTIYTTGGPGAALTDVTNLGTYHLRGGANLTIGGGGLVNDGTLSVNSNVSGAEAHLLFSTNAMLDGTGVVFLNNTGRFAQVNTAPGVTVTQAAGHTIRGTGQINAALVNNGLVESAPVAATSGLVLQTNDKTNNHVFRAAGGVELEINGITVTQNATGRIIADESNVEITAGAHIVGGTLETVGAGTVFTTASATLSGVTNQGTYHVRGGAELMIIGGGGLTNHGVLTVNSNNAGSEAHLLFTTNAMLGGTGEVVLNTSGRFAQLNTAPAAFVTNGPEHTIRGLGQVNGNVINDGRMEGNSGTELLEINGFVGGSGVLQDVRIDGTHSPGASPAAVDLEGVYSIASIGKLIIEIGGPAPGSQHDQLNSIGMVNLNGLLDVLSIDAGAGTFIPALGQEFRIITSNNPILGTFRNATATSRAGLTNIEWDIVYRTNEVLLQVTGLSVVPEPGTLILELTALAACLFLRRRFS